MASVGRFLGGVQIPGPRRLGFHARLMCRCVGNCLLSCHRSWFVAERKGERCGRSSGVEHNLAKVGVEGSNPFARSSRHLAEPG